MNKKLLILPLTLILVSCGPNLPPLDENEGDPNTEINEDHQEKNVESITLNRTNLVLNEGETFQLTYTISPSDAENKNVTWSVIDAAAKIVCTVKDGLVTGCSEGTSTVQVKTEDGNKTATCSVVVTKKIIEEETKEYVFDFNKQGYTTSEVDMPEQLDVTDDVSIKYEKSNGSTSPTIIQYNNEYTGRAYAGNTITISSEKSAIKKIIFEFGKKDGSNEITTNCGLFSENTWIGNSKSVVFSIGGTSGHRRIKAFSIFCVKNTQEKPDEFENLGEMTISEVKEYISANPVKKNSFGNGVNTNKYVTIKGFALAKIDLEKSLSAYGLNVSEHGKVIMADSTDYIAVATKISGDGNTFWGKVNDHVCKDTSRYIVSGYISEYLGNPEILVDSFEWDQTLNISWNPEIISKATIDLPTFYSKATSINYNCAGHGYGEVVTIKNLTCFYSESDGQGKRYYNFTDGNKNIRVNAYNLSSVSEGHSYDITGIISLKNLSPIIVAFKMTQSNSEPINIDYENIATDITISGLKNIHGSQDDTSAKYPEVINAYGTIYKTTGYLTAVIEGGKLYVGLSSTFRADPINGKTNAKANYDVVLIKNENFWNTTEDELYLFNSYYDDYLMEENLVTLYYIPRQLSYSQNKPCWEILLIPSSIPQLVEE